MSVEAEEEVEAGPGLRNSAGAADGSSVLVPDGAVIVHLAYLGAIFVAYNPVGIDLSHLRAVFVPDGAVGVYLPDL